jgi:hypothetical protein
MERAFPQIRTDYLGNSSFQVHRWYYLYGECKAFASALLDSPPKEQ